MAAPTGFDRTGMERICGFVNGKGGVLKTTLTANIGALLASFGWKVLLVDMDPQGNLGLDLGYRHEPQDDDGSALAQSLLFGVPLAPLKDVRANLDVVPGGGELDQAAAGLISMGSRDSSKSKLALARSLFPVAADYDVILIDCPPGNEPLQVAALGAASYVVVPTKTDKAGREGLVGVAKRLDAVLDVNPNLDLLGVIITATSPTATNVHRTTREAITETFGDDSVLFKGMVRHAEAPAQAARDRGVLVHELEEQVKAAPKWWEVRKGTAQAVQNQPRSAANVAEDLYQVTHELVARLEAAEKRNAS
ncbi:ParA family protein [Arthrobacter sp. Soil763]|uniref:ParA family protein n=1 Tax=Arthrobacter sp. Soil763 TaxID=1736402 RepID=UPI0009EB1B8B|nr:ParA family protein [Arthrobacter sp. Soil763]